MIVGVLLHLVFVLLNDYGLNESDSCEELSNYDIVVRKVCTF